MFRWLTERSEVTRLAERLLTGCVERSRAVALYRDFGVEDSISGRFEMLAVQVVLLMRRLRSVAPDGTEVARQLAERMFAALDDDLREQGIGYMAVPKKMRQTASAFYGRAEAYDAALGADSDDALVSALARNVYGTVAADGPVELSRYVRQQDRLLTAASDADVLADRWWPPAAIGNGRTAEEGAPVHG